MDSWIKIKEIKAVKCKYKIFISDNITKKFTEKKSLLIQTLIVKDTSFKVSF